MEQERKLATIRKIKDIKPIPDADQIEIVVVDGWEVIVKKDENYKVGDLVIYCEIDSFLPVKPEFEFLRKSSYKKLVDGTEGFRLKTVKMRGVISQGLVLPLSILERIEMFDMIVVDKDEEQILAYYNPEDIKIAMDREGFIPDYKEFNIMDDISELLGITKYDSQSQVSYSGNAKGSFPAFIPRTDEERAQNLLEVLDRYQDEVYYVTEKIDGSSFTCYKKEDAFGVCSRNLEVKEELVNGDYDRYWKTAKNLHLQEKLSSLSYNISLQGELSGPGVQKNPYKLNNLNIFFFNAYNIDEKRYLNYEEFFLLMKDLELNTVPLIYREVTLRSLIEDNNKSLIENLLHLADGKSVLADTKREGLVFRSINEYNNIRGTYNGRLSFKVISNSFLLKEK